MWTVWNHFKHHSLLNSSQRLKKLHDSLVICGVSHSSPVEGWTNHLHPLKEAAAALRRSSVAVNITGLEKVINIHLYRWKCPDNVSLALVQTCSLRPRKERELISASANIQRASYDLLMKSTLESYWFKRWMIWCIWAESGRKEGLKCVGVCAFLFFSLWPDALLGQGSGVVLPPRSPHINIVHELI